MWAALVTRRRAAASIDVMALYVAGLWRYPVKSLAGEPLTTATLAPDGIIGDRLVVVAGPEGVRTSRKQHRLLGLRGTLDRHGRALINGYPWDSDEALRLVRDAAGEDAWLEESHETNRFDILPLLVATDGAVAEFGRDVRRLRPNILIGGVEGMTEREWPGATLEIGDDVVVRLDSLRTRCPMTTVDPDTLARDPEVLRDIGRRFGGRLALNAGVVHAGTLRVPAGVRLGGQTGVRLGSVRLGSDRGQTGVKPGSDEGQTGVRPPTVSDTNSLNFRLPSTCSFDRMRSAIEASPGLAMESANHVCRTSSGASPNKDSVERVERNDGATPSPAVAR